MHSLCVVRCEFCLKGTCIRLNLAGASSSWLEVDYLLVGTPLLQRMAQNGAMIYSSTARAKTRVASVRETLLVLQRRNLLAGSAVLVQRAPIACLSIVRKVHSVQPLIYVEGFAEEANTFTWSLIIDEFAIAFAGTWRSIASLRLDVVSRCNLLAGSAVLVQRAPIACLSIVRKVHSVQPLIYVEGFAEEANTFTWSLIIDEFAIAFAGTWRSIASLRLDVVSRCSMININERNVDRHRSLLYVLNTHNLAGLISLVLDFKFASLLHSSCADYCSVVIAGCGLYRPQAPEAELLATDPSPSSARRSSQCTTVFESPSNSNIASHVRRSRIDAALAGLDPGWLESSRESTGLVVGPVVFSADDGDSVSEEVLLALVFTIRPFPHVFFDSVGEVVVDFAGRLGLVAAITIGAATLVVARVCQLVVECHGTGREEKESDGKELHGEQLNEVWEMLEKRTGILLYGEELRDDRNENERRLLSTIICSDRARIDVSKLLSIQ
nr:hypothetical protein CFP56_10124 [Quercus suber]